MKGGSFTDSGALRFPVSKEPQDVARAVLFGPYATSQGQVYTKETRRPLSAKQTQEYLQSSNPQEYYERLMHKRKEEAEKKKDQNQ